MTTSIRSEATRSVVEVNGVDVLSVKPDGGMEILTTSGMTGNHIPMMRQVASKPSTSGTFVDFTDIPNWVKRITVVFNGVSTNGSSPILVRMGAGSIEASGYSSSGNSADAGIAIVVSTTGMVIRNVVGGNVLSLLMDITNAGGNTWIASHAGTITGASCFGGGNKTLSGVLDRVRVTTENGTDAFDAGSVSVIYEG